MKAVRQLLQRDGRYTKSLTIDSIRPASKSGPLEPKKCQKNKKDDGPAAGRMGNVSLVPEIMLLAATLLLRNSELSMASLMGDRP